MSDTIYDIFTETDQLSREGQQLEYEGTVDFAGVPQRGDTFDYEGVTWKVERRHFTGEGSRGVLLVVSQFR